MWKRFGIATLLSLFLLYPCLLFLDLFEPEPWDSEIRLLIALLIALFSYQITGR